MRQSRTRRVIALLALFVVLTGWFAPDAADASTTKEFSIVSLDTTATVNPDGSMDVVEKVRYSFSGTFTVGIRSFQSNEDDIRDFSVTDKTGTLRVELPSESLSGDFEWFFAQPITDADRTFTVRYHVDDAVQVGPDVGELYWQFIGDDHPGIGSMTVALDMPGDAPNATPSTPADDASVLRAWGHGPPNGTVELSADGDAVDVRASVESVPSATFVELRVLVPSDAFTVSPSGGPRLADVLDDEGGFIGTMTEKPNALRDIGRTAAPIAAIVSLIGLVLLWFGFGRERRSVEVQGEYWREPLDLQPAVALVNLERGSVPAGSVIAATIIDMAQRGYLTITGRVEERFGPDKTIHTFRWAGKQYSEDVRPFEKRVLEMVFHGQSEVTDDDITEWAKANRTTAAARLAGMKKTVHSDWEQQHFMAKTDGLALGLLAVLCLLVLVTGIVALVAGTGLGWVAIAAAIGVLVLGFGLLTNRSQAGAEAAAKAEGLKRYLKDFSNLEEAPVGHLILWERYLVFAVAFGVADELLHGLQTKLPSVAQDPAFGVWYVGPRGHFDGLGQMGSIGSDINTSFTPPSKSGSGGGFSGGGGGGGGGGGFGAR